MHGECRKSYLWMVLKGLKVYLNLIQMSEKIIMRILMKDIFFKSKFSIQKKLHDLHNDLPFLSEKNEN